MTRKATIGTISHGTLRSKDLLSAFADELEAIDTEREYAELVTEARAVLTLINAGWPDIANSDEASELINDALPNALNDYAPPYCYFGVTEGDGSDFGFWPSFDAIEELDKFNDLADVPDDQADDYVIVNDHGNVSVYGADGELIWDCV